MSSKSAIVDRLSLLPDEVLSHILSLMPTKSAVGTSIFSKRWRYCWTFIHSFDFHYIDRNIPDSSTRFLSFVDRVLNLSKTSQIKLFRLHFSKFLVGNPHVLKWINEAVKLHVCELDVQVIMRELPFSLFTCKTLTKLKLSVGSYDSCVFNVPSGVILPCLKTLDINVFKVPFVNVSKLINICPLLESLILSIESRQWGKDNEEYNINIPTLKRFELKTPRHVSVISVVVLNVPNLEYLVLGGTLCSVFVMEDFPSFVKATVSYSEVEYKHLMIELLKGLNETKSISWSTSTIGVPLDFPLPKFPNLKYLKFKGFSYFGWVLMLEVLQHSSELEHLIIDEAIRLFISFDIFYFVFFFNFFYTRNIWLSVL